MQGGSRAGWLIVLALAACAAPSSQTPPPAPAATTAPPRTPPPPAPPPELSAPSPAPKPAASDACGASELQYLVGKPRTDIPVPLIPSRRRVVCSTCVMTQDFVPYRQTVVYDASTGLVTSVRCG